MNAGPVRACMLLAVALAACHQQQPPAGTTAPGASPPPKTAPAPAVQTVPTAPAGLAGDPQAGAKLAAQGAPDKGVAPCGSCHGADGAGNAATGFPALAAQPAEYLRSQLDSYADGSRANPIMAQVAKGLSPQQRADAAAYFATLAPAAGQAAAAAPAGSRGLTLAQYGDEQLHVQACANCHGPQGAGEPPAYPYLAGQNAQYLTAALKAWSDGSRHNDPSGLMPALARSLPAADVTALAQYFSALPRPAPGQWSGAVPATASGPPASSGGGEAAPHPGADTEQGAPLSGGGQGPGGGGGTDNRSSPGQPPPR